MRKLEEITNIILQAYGEIAKKVEGHYKVYGLETSVPASWLVRKTQQIAEEKAGYIPSKMTVWRYLKKMVKEGKFVLEEKPPTNLTVTWVKLQAKE